jgi:hypothetical protein
MRYPIGTTVEIWANLDEQIPASSSHEVNKNSVKITAKIIKCGEAYATVEILPNTYDIKGWLGDIEEDEEGYNANKQYYHIEWDCIIGQARECDGMFCCDCKNFFQYAVANLKNDALLCYSCRSSNAWKYEEFLR